MRERRFRARVAYALALWFGCGRSPVAPGTVGTLGALPLYFLLAPLGPFVILALAITVTLVGIWAAGVVCRLQRREDPQIIVIDEVAGILLTLAVAPADWKGVTIGFVLFRLFDQTKPFPARLMERLPGGYGVMLDDVVAAVWAGSLLFAGQLLGWL